MRREPSRQLGRGATNIVTGIWEVPKTMHQVNQDRGGYAAASYGLFQGIWRFATREVVGVLEVLTFPMGWPSIIEPEFPFEPTKTTEWRVNRPVFRERL